MTSKEAASKRIRELEEELEGHRKKARSTSDSVAAEYTCPLSLEVFVDPVRAEDTFDYERAEIERVIKHQGKIQGDTRSFANHQIIHLPLLYFR